MINGIDKYFQDITVERSSKGVDSWGNPIQVWSTHDVVKGVIRQLSGSEANVSNKDTPISTHRMYCRKTDIKTIDRLLFNGVYYDVENVNNVMNFDELLQVELNVV